MNKRGAKSLRAVEEGSEGEERGKTGGVRRLRVAVQATEAPQEFGNQ